MPGGSTALGALQVRQRLEYASSLLLRSKCFHWLKAAGTLRARYGPTEVEAAEAEAEDGI